MSLFGVANQALHTSRYLIGLAADNIANANTPGYHVKRAIIAPGAAYAASGAEVQDVVRVRDELVERALLYHVQVLEREKKEAEVMGHLEALFGEPSDGGLDASLGALFDSLTQLAGDPENPVMRRQVVQKAESLSSQFNKLGRSLREVAKQAADAAIEVVDEVNDLARGIAEVNVQIRSAETAGGDTSAMSDRRDQLITQLAKLIDVKTVRGDLGQFSVISSGLVLVSDGVATPLNVSDSPGGLRVAYSGETTHALDIEHGKLGGLLHIANEVLPDCRTSLDDLANGLRRSMNLVHTTALGLEGRFTELQGLNRFPDDTPFADVGYGVRSGTAEKLVINVEDTATGEVTQFELALDTTQPANDFVQSVRELINTNVDHVTASISDGRLFLGAQEGYAFGFATPYDPNPAAPGDISAPNPTAPRILGDYNGGQDLDYEFHFTAGGEVGVDPLSVSVDVRDASGTVVRTLTRALDADYRPGNAVGLESGLKFALGEGNVAAGDGFSFTAHAEMDSAGVLDALGLNVFFSGLGAEGIDVAERVLAEPRNLAASALPSPSDNSRLLEMLDTPDEKVLGGGTATLNEFYRTLLGGLAATRNEKLARQDSEESLVQVLENNRDAISGVNVDEEMIKIVEGRSIYQAALKYISTLDEMLSSLLSML